MKKLIVLLGVVAFLTVGCWDAKPPQPASVPQPPQPPQLVEGQKELTEAVGKSLEKGLEFLFTNQKEDGSIVNDQPGAEQAALGATGLAVSGASRAPKEIRAKYEEKIAKACKYILSKQMKDGSFQGAEGMPTYTTAIAIMALHNADAKKYAEFVKQGQEYLIKAQYYSEVKAEDLNYGGWTYGQGAKGEGKQANMSTTHYALMALRGTGVSKDHEVFKRAVVYVGRSQNNSETNEAKGWKILDDGGFTYGPRMTRGSKDKKGLVDENGKQYFPSYASMTYAGFKSLLYANLPKDDQRVLAALSWMKNNYTLDKNTGMGYRENEKKEMEQQGLYYFYNAFARAMDAWGEKEFEDVSGAKHNWAAELCRKLLGKQVDDGSWINLAEERWHEGMKTIATGYSVDALCTCIPWLEK